ncbi:MAG TPA: peptide deformylase [Planctomycetaceae bacterium]|nr:peptide deformylase [Planctomycetaceae bacterium]
MEIVHYPHPSLRWKSQPVREINVKLKSIVHEMFDLMYEHKGIGLAANQVALPLRVFVMNPSGERQESDQELVFINPEILRKKGTIEGEEGCLSLPDVYGQVRRAEDILVSAFDLTGKEFRLELDDLLSRIVQHESDHLDGVMFFDRMDEEERSKIEAKIADFDFEFRKGQNEGEIPSDVELKRQLAELQP